MPLYDYHCDSCGDFREVRPMAESNALGVCPGCGGQGERVISAPFLGKDPHGQVAHRPSGKPSVLGACGHAHGCSHSHHGA